MKKYRLFGKIPVFDIVVVAVLILAVVVCINVFGSSKSGSTIASTEYKTIRYTIEFYNLSNMIDGVPDEGEIVRDNVNNYDVGKVVFAEATPAVVYGINELTGETVETVYNDRQTIKVVVEAKATIAETGTQVNNVKLGIGRFMTFNMPSLCATGTIKNIEIVEG